MLIVDFASLFLASLTAGSMFAVWLLFNPAGLDAGFYIALHQQGVRTLNRKMPALGAATTLLTTTAAALSRGDAVRCGMLAAAAICFLVSGLITRFLNQPINSTVMTWSVSSPPPGWTELRDKWWTWHRTRLATGLAGLLLLIAATRRPGWVG